MEIKNQYQNLLDSGDLLALYPSLTGNWEEDKAQFTKEYIKTQELYKQSSNDLKMLNEALETLNTDFDEDEIDDYYEI
jgi:hypothetical protein